MITQQRHMGGYVFMMVVVTLFLLAAVALHMGREASIAGHISVGASQKEAARYIAEAGFNHGRSLANNLNCEAYTNLPPTPLDDLDSGHYSVSFSANGGSPVAITAEGNTDAGASFTLNRWATIYSPPETYNLPVQQDTFISGSPATKNHGSEPVFRVEGPDVASALLRFDLTGLSSGTNIAQAVLTLYKNKEGWGGDIVLDAHQITAEWSEFEVNYNERKTGVPWAAAGASGNYAATPAGSSGVVPLTYIGPVQIDITGVVSQWVAGADNFGLILRSNSPWADLTVSTREHGVDPAPSLEITYRCECGQSCEADFSCNPHLLAVQAAHHSTPAGTVLQHGVTYIPAGKTFRSITAPEEGMILTASNTAGNPLQLLSTAGDVILSYGLKGTISGLSGVAWVTGGAWQDHVLVAAQGDNSIHVYNPAGQKVTELALPSSFVVEGIGHIGETQSGLYDHHWLVVGPRKTLLFGQIVQQVYLMDQNLSIKESFDVTSEVGKLSGVSHLPGRDAFIVADAADNRVVAFDFTGTKLSHYGTTAYKTGTLGGVAVNSYSCQHVLADESQYQYLALEQAVGCAARYADDFSAQIFNGSSGSFDWSTSPWDERGESNGPTSGGVQIRAAGQLAISGPNNGITRMADLDPQLGQQLSFKRKRTGTMHDMDPTQKVELIISSHSGSPWVTLASFGGGANDSQFIDENFDISAYATSTTQIGFRSSADIEPDAVLLVDDFAITSCAP